MMPDTVVPLAADMADAVFAEPWQAQAFAMTMNLSRRGAFTWGEWVEVFSSEICAHPARAGEASADAYYRQWLAALETILTTRGLSTTEEISGVQELWRQAYLNTPHGLPIELENAGRECVTEHAHHDHDHGDHVVAVRQPVAVSPATPRS